MADLKITELPEDTSPVSENLLIEVDDPLGTPINKKVKLSNLAQALSGLLPDDQHVLDSEVLAVASAKIHGALHLPNAADPIGLPKFSAHKNGINQEGIVTATWTKVTFTTEVYDDGAKYDHPNSKWVPGIIGKVHVMGSIIWTSAVDQTQMMFAFYLNGSSYKDFRFQSSGTGYQGNTMACDIPIAVITDYIEIYVYQASGSNKDIYGAAIATWFMGHMLP